MTPKRTGRFIHVSVWISSALPSDWPSPILGSTRPGRGFMRNLQRKLSVARGEQPAELLFKNAQLVNVLSGEVHPAHVAVDDGRIIGLGEYEAESVTDPLCRFLVPNLIDGHFHVESALLTIPDLCRAVVPHGTGAMVIDPHEFANVLGLDGIRYALESSRGLPVDFFIMLPSC